MEAARSRLADDATIAQLLTDVHPDLRLQGSLANDESPEVRERVAASISYLHLFERLLVDSVPTVRGACAANPRITQEQMERLVGDKTARVRASVPAYGLLFPDSEQLLRLAHDRSKGVRWRVIFRVDSPREALEVLTTDSDEVNRQHAQYALSDIHRILSSDVIESERSRRAAAMKVAPFERAPA